MSTSGGYNGHAVETYARMGTPKSSDSSRAETVIALHGVVTYHLNAKMPLFIYGIKMIISQ